MAVTGSMDERRPGVDVIDLEPTGPRRGEHHFAVRFGDHDGQVYKDGEAILDCYEVDVDAGKAWRYDLDSIDAEGWPIPYIDNGNFSISKRIGRVP